MGTVFVGLIIIAIVAMAIRSVKKGGGCDCGGDCSSCSTCKGHDKH